MKTVSIVNKLVFTKFNVNTLKKEIIFTKKRGHTYDDMGVGGVGRGT